jgi:hypothetical protein
MGIWHQQMTSLLELITYNYQSETKIHDWQESLLSYIQHNNYQIRTTRNINNKASHEQESSLVEGLYWIK